MRAFLVGMTAISGTIGFALACSPRPLELGTNDVPFDGAATAPSDDARDASSAHLPSYEARLNALCNEPAGTVERYGSARDLTEILVGRWYLCGDPSTSPLLDPAGVEFDATGHWTILQWGPDRASLTPSADPDQRGPFEYYAFSDPDAGVGADGGGGPRSVGHYDPQPRGGLFIYLKRAVSIDIVILVDFERGPRRMSMRAVGPSNLAAFYVATDPI
jgi:hypothetical protein